MASYKNRKECSASRLRKRRGRHSHNLPLPIFSFQNGAALRPVVVVDVEGVGEGEDELAVVLSKLLVPAPPDHVVEANLVVPAESQASKAANKRKQEKTVTPLAAGGASVYLFHFGDVIFCL